MKFSIGSGGSKPKRAKIHSVEPSCNGKMGPKSTRVHFPLDSFDSAGKPIIWRSMFPPIQKKKWSGKVMDESVMTHRAAPEV